MTIPAEDPTYGDLGGAFPLWPRVPAKLFSLLRGPFGGGSGGRIR